MQKIIDFIKENTGATSDILAYAMLVVIGLIIVFGLIGIGISIYLWTKYHKLNKTKNSCGLTGEQAARKILDDNGLEKIKVKCTGSMIWGNSYSHYFHKVRLRRFTYKKDSVTSLAMAAQKSSLAILDKEKDPAMRTRNILIPIQFFGPIMFLPLILIGILIDFLIAKDIKNMNFTATLIFAGIGILFYVIAFILTGVILKVETKGQKKAIEILRKDNLATEEEIKKIEGLYKVYNLEYINNMILAFLELVLRVLQIIAAAQGSSSRSSSSN